MTNADRWARVVEARTERDDLRPKRVWVLRKDGREAAIDVKAVPGIRAEIVLSVDGAAQDAAVPVTRGAGRRNRGHADDVWKGGVGVNRSGRQQGPPSAVAPMLSTPCDLPVYALR